MMIRTLCAASLASWLGACATYSPQSSPPTYQGCRTWEQQQASGAPHLAAVQVLSPELARVIGVHEVSTARTGTGMAAVQTSVYNCTDADVVLLMRTRFTGSRGQSEPPSAWKTVFVPPRGTVAYGESAVSESTLRVAVDIYDANRGQSQYAPGQTYIAPQGATTFR